MPGQRAGPQLIPHTDLGALESRGSLHSRESWPWLLPNHLHIQGHKGERHLSQSHGGVIPARRIPQWFGAGTPHGASGARVNGGLVVPRVTGLGQGRADHLGARGPRRSREARRAVSPLRRRRKWPGCPSTAPRQSRHGSLLSSPVLRVLLSLPALPEMQTSEPCQGAPSSSWAHIPSPPWLASLTLSPGLPASPGAPARPGSPGMPGFPGSPARPGGPGGPLSPRARPGGP